MNFVLTFMCLNRNFFFLMLEMIKQINISINRKILLKGNLYFYCVATFCPIYIVRHYILLYYTPEENFVLVLSV